MRPRYAWSVRAIWMFAVGAGDGDAAVAAVDDGAACPVEAVLAVADVNGGAVFADDRGAGAAGDA